MPTAGLRERERISRLSDCEEDLEHSAGGVIIIVVITIILISTAAAAATSVVALPVERVGERHQLDGGTVF